MGCLKGLPEPPTKRRYRPGPAGFSLAFDKDWVQRGFPE